MAHEFELMQLATSELDFPLGHTPYDHAVALLSGYIGEHANTREEYVALGLSYLDVVPDSVEEAIAELKEKNELRYGPENENNEFEDDTIWELRRIEVRAEAVDPIAFQKVLEAEWDDLQERKSCA